MTDTATQGPHGHEGVQPRRIYRQVLIFATKHRVAIVSAILAFVGAVAVLRPWRSINQNVDAANVSRQWNESIAKLGIEPVFPPQEGIYVGDIFAVLIGGDESANHTFLGSTVYLDHANVRWAFSNKGRDTPIFSASGENAQKPDAAKEVDVPSQYADNEIRLNTVGFPGVSIDHLVKMNGTFGFVSGFGSTAREDTELEHIHLPVAQTYGISPPDAYSALDNWCSDQATKLKCTRDFATRMLTHTFGDDFIDKRPQPKDVKIAVFIISRVYVAREFDIQRGRKTDVSGSVGMSSAGSHETAEPDAAEPGEGKRVQMPTMAGTQTFSTDEGIKQVFDRPIVFGFNSVKIGL